jgi:hypothetical protein
MESDRPDRQHRPSTEGPDEALRRLERRLDEASAAAERVIAEAAQAAASARANDAAAGDELRTPPRGWRAPEPDEGIDRGADLEPVLAFLRSLRDLIPPELQRRLAEALRELLLALRAVIDWYLEHLEGRRSTAPEVQDIPIL